MFKTIKYKDQVLARTLLLRCLYVSAFLLLMLFSFVWWKLRQSLVQVNNVQYVISFLVILAIVLLAETIFLKWLYTSYSLSHRDRLANYLKSIEFRQMLSLLMVTKGLFETKSDDDGEFVSYFPKVRVKFKFDTGQMVLEEPINGEQFMERFDKGEFDAVVETAFMADRQTNVYLKNKMISTFAFDPIKFRLKLSALKPKKGSLNIVKGIDWKYDKFYNMLVSGNVGTGKSYFLFAILGQLLAITKFIVVFDPKRSDLGALQYTDILKGKVFSTNTAINEQIHIVYEAMMERAKKMEKIKAEGKIGAYMEFNFKPHFMFFDEFGAWKEMNDKLAFGTPERKAYDLASGDLNEIAMMGRELGFYLIVGMQRPSADSLPMAIRNQLNFRVVMGKPTPEIQKMLFPDSDKELRPLSNDLKGWGFFQMGDGAVRAFFAPEVEKGFNLHEFMEHMGSLREAG
ncbi:cell division protein FtsK [Weissella coleopterorum]|uniref:Cell division protein FtsK n=1 Tax=Weissella coleopterorum TaxID=2714949 RepID=A0A6G8AY65_9LACO|nr:cell division protein FtsK [Weissella coleopterorum]QIL49920.1 cell division protein FtsK [Weissella coleopterorum]